MVLKTRIKYFYWETLGQKTVRGPPKVLIPVFRVRRVPARLLTMKFEQSIPGVYLTEVKKCEISFDHILAEPVKYVSV